MAGVWKGTEREFFKTPFSFPQTLARPSRFPRAQNLLFPPFQTPATQATVIIEDSTPLTQIPKGESKNKKKKERENHSGRWKYVELTDLVPLAKLHWNAPKSQSVCPALLLSVSRRQLSAWWSNLGLKVCFLNITLLVSGRCALENASYMLFVQASPSQPWNGVETWKEKTPARRRGKTFLKALGIVSF